jgi:acetyl esterase/lipase
VRALLLLAAALSAPAQAEDTTAGAVAAPHLATEYASLANITYAVAGGVDLKLDVYKPRAAGAPRPTLVFIHGGGWVSGAKEDAVLWLVPWLEAGWSAVNVEYRLARVARAPAAVEDVRCALRWVARYASDHGFDPARIVVSGDSAGGHLALAAAMLPASSGFERGCTVPYPAGTNSWVSVPEWNVVPAAVVNWYGITDVAEMMSGPGARGYAIEWLGSNPDHDALAHALSPLTHVRAGVPPVISIHGDADVVVPYSNSVLLHQALTKAGVPNRLVTIPGGSHGGFTHAQLDTAYAAINKFLAEVIKLGGNVGRGASDAPRSPPDPPAGAVALRAPPPS